MDVQVLIHVYLWFLFTRGEYKVKSIKIGPKRQGNIELLWVLRVSLNLRDSFPKQVLENCPS